MTSFYCVISNFTKRIVLLLTKDFVVQKMEAKRNSIKLSTFLKHGLTKVKNAPSQMFDFCMNTVCM